MTRSVLLGLTLGDPAGIGPEVAIKAACGRRWPRSVRLVLVGSLDVIRAECRRQKRPMPPPWTPEAARRPASAVSVWDPLARTASPAIPSLGRCTAGGARLAVAWITAAVRACLDGTLDGLVTGPINKEGLKRAGIAFPGHTELLASLTGTRRFAMLLAGGGLRVVLATRHIRLARVAAELKPRQIMEAAELMSEALPWLGVRGGTIGICALNPHGGDGGALGDEERRTIEPAVRALQQRGLPVAGPVPADVIFHQALQGRYAAVMAMYHDQGLAPLKLLAFDSGVNITLGLPIVRTSPDHGTACDIAGRGVAKDSSMIAAIRRAADLAVRPNPWRPPARGRS